MSENDAFLSIADLHVSYGDIDAVRGITFDVCKGEMVTLLGPSGCGKTTTLRCIAGLEDPRCGTISLEGETLTRQPGGVLIVPEKRSLAMVFQSYAIWPHMNVFENVAYGLRARGVDGSEIRRRVRDVLDIVGLADMEVRPATQLSGGQQQRVALARAIVLEPKILLLDEPLSNLDAKLRETTRTELRELQQRLGITAVYVTHDQTEAMALSDRLIVFRNGAVEQEGMPLDVYYNPQTAFVADFMGLANLLEGKCVQMESGGHEIDTSIGRIRCAGTDVIRVGDPVIVCLRPERIRLRLSSGGGDGFEGRIVRRAHLGEMVDYTVRVKEQDLRVRSMPSAELPQEEAVRLSLDGRPVAVPFEELD